MVKEKNMNLALLNCLLIVLLYPLISLIIEIRMDLLQTLTCFNLYITYLLFEFILRKEGRYFKIIKENSIVKLTKNDIKKWNIPLLILSIMTLITRSYITAIIYTNLILVIMIHLLNFKRKINKGKSNRTELSNKERLIIVLISMNAVLFLFIAIGLIFMFVPMITILSIIYFGLFYFIILYFVVVLISYIYVYKSIKFLCDMENRENENKLNKV